LANSAVTGEAFHYKLIAPELRALSAFWEASMGSGTNGNGRYSLDSRAEQLMLEAGTGIGRVLNDRQRHAASLTVQVFAYLIAALPGDELTHNDVIQLLRWYSRGISNAKSES
jgi:hypothetical protein